MIRDNLVIVDPQTSVRWQQDNNPDTLGCILDNFLPVVRSILLPVLFPHFPRCIQPIYLNPSGGNQPNLKTQGSYIQGLSWLNVTLVIQCKVCLGSVTNLNPIHLLTTEMVDKVGLPHRTIANKNNAHEPLGL